MTVRGKFSIIAFAIVIAIGFGICIPGHAIAQAAKDSTVAVPDSSRYIEVVLPVQKRFPVYDLFPRKSGILSVLSPDQIKTEIVKNADGTYQIARSFYGITAVPGGVNLDLKQLSEELKREAVRQNMAAIIKEQQAKQDVQRGLLDFKITIPGGQKSAFTTIFGKPEVNLSVTGRANMNIGASVIRDAQLAASQQQRRIDPQFNQNLQLNIQGTIGDKLSIRTDWDTERPFDYQNRLSIVYEGYEDEILKRVELGNVSMETGNSLVRGGGALFGVKSTAQVGPVRITSVLSQKEGSSQTETLAGGSREDQISVRPARYQFDQHYFIDFFSMQEFERAVADPMVVTIPIVGINQVRVYRQINTGSLQNDGVRAVALAELGVVQNPSGAFLQPDMRYDRFDDQLLETNRSRENLTAADLGVAEGDFVADFFQELKLGEDYDINLQLGIISFRSSLNSQQQAIAISFQYQNRLNEVVQVGELAPIGTRQWFYLKMIRPNIVQARHRLWPLMLKNMYSVGLTGLRPDGTKIDIFFTGENPERDFLPNVSTSRNLLQDLGLDRLGPQGASPDNLIDFSITFNGNSGVIMFPYLEPFGSRINDLIERSTNPADKSQLRQRYVFPELYTQLPLEAANRPVNSNYEIRGKAKGAVSGEYSLGFALVEGSVRVTANGARLVEGTDFEVDYALGFIRIINEAYLKPGYAINIDYENNNLLQIQQTTFTGVRAEYEVNENVRFGTTYFRMREIPLTDKIRVGDEPVNNTVIGFDGTGRFNAPWLTRFIDRIPLLQTKEPSEIMFAGEFAQLRPNVARTPAVQDLVNKNRLFSDEKRGVSFIDDFEGVENNVSFMNAFRWFLAASPAGIPGYDATFGHTNVFGSTTSDKLARNNLRAQFSWYVLPVVSNVRRGPESELIRQSQLFQRQVMTSEDILRTIDFYYNPGERGPYNYNMNLRSVLEQRRQDMWGGVTSVLPGGQENLTQNNVEFIEFWVQFILPNGRNPEPQDLQDYNGRILFDLGQISEDVIPNAQLNSEDGLSEQGEKVVDAIGQSYVQNSPSAIRDGAFAQNSISEEDVGLDGVRSSAANRPDTEQILFKEFVDKMKIDYADQPEIVNAIEQDPSNDDYVFWNSQEAASKASAFHELFYRFLGYHEGNSAMGRQAYNKPDSEGLRTNNVSKTNQYFQYELRINPADTTTLAIGTNHIVDRSTYESARGAGAKFYQRWYQVRIPIRAYDRKVGEINDFRAITHIRMWLTGYKKPFTMRFASFELVGSQWRKATEIYQDDPATAFRVATVNREENSSRRPVPYVVPTGAITAVNRGQQNLLANEQSLVMQVQNLPRGQQRFITRTYEQALNLLNYENLRMFVHGEGYLRRSDAEVVIRFGNDLQNNYYEYRQPVTPSDPDFPYTFGASNVSNQDKERENDEVWKHDENSVNVVLSAFNILKQKRNSLGKKPTEPYSEPLTNLLNQTVGLTPGGYVVIKGEPTLGSVKFFALGIANPLVENAEGVMNPNFGTPALDGEFWLNELRLSGYDNRNGWRAAARTSVKMADFATVSANYNQSTEGYDGIQSKLGRRQRFDDRNVDVSSQINLHKFIPDRYGWSIPLNVTYRNQFQQNVFMTQEADIRWTDYQQAIITRDDLTPAEKQTLLNLKQQEIQNVNENFTFTLANIGKSFSKSKFAQATLDNLRFSVNYNVADGRSKDAFRNQQWSYQAGLNYNLTFKEIRYWAPFQWLEGVPVLNQLDAIRFTLKPTSITTAANLQRTYTENDRRVFGDAPPLPLLQNHNMAANGNFGINFNPMPSVTVNYGNATAFNLSVVSIDTLSARARADTTKRLYLLSTPEVINRILTDPGAQPQRQNYAEKWAFSWRPRLNTNKNFNWLTYSYNYTAGFNWANADVIDIDPKKNRRLGARIDNNGTSTHTMRFGIEEILKKIPAYAKAQDADRKAQRDREVANKKRQDEKKKLQMQRQKEREEAEKARKAALAGAKQPSGSEKPKSEIKDPAGAAQKAVQPSVAPKETQAQAPKPVEKGGPAPRKQKETAKPEAQPVAPAAATQPGQGGAAGKAAPAPQLADDKTKQAAQNASPLVFYARRLLMNVTSFKALDVNYSVRNQAAQAGYDGTAPIYFMFGNQARNTSPNLAYRLGFANRLSTERLVLGDGQMVNLTWGNSENLTARTQFTPMRNMNVDLNWAVEWGEKTDQQLSRAANGDLKQALGRNGTFSTTTLVLGKGYRNLYERQLQTAFDDISGTSIVDSLGNRDGRSVLELVTLHNDFREAYMGSIGKFALGRYGFGALPLPNWNLTYSGIETMFPVLQDYIARVSLTHAYRGRYRSGYRFNPNVENGNSLAGASSNRLGGFTVFQPLAEHSPDQSALESAFAPLVGLNITWKNQMRTQFDFERSKRITMSYTSARIDETNTRGIKFSVNYEKRGFKLPLMKKLQNTLTATLNFGYAEDLTQRYQLSNDLNRSLTAGDPAFVARDPKLGTIVIDAPTGTGRINGSAVIGYQFSSMITANFEYAYTHIMPRSTNTFERVTQDFRFNIVVAIRGN